MGLTRGCQSRWMDTLGQHVHAVAIVSDGGAADQRHREMFEESTCILLQCWQQESVATKQPHYEIRYPYETGVIDYPGHESIETVGASGELGPDGTIRRVSIVPSPCSNPYPQMFVPMSGNAASTLSLAQHGFCSAYFTALDTLVNLAMWYVEDRVPARILRVGFISDTMNNLAR